MGSVKRDAFKIRSWRALKADTVVLPLRSSPRKYAASARAHEPGTGKQQGIWSWAGDGLEALRDSMHSAPLILRRLDDYADQQLPRSMHADRQRHLNVGCPRWAAYEHAIGGLQHFRHPQRLLESWHNAGRL
jgi:hypothetical protein